MSLRVCCISYHAYPVIEPSVRETVGGTETRAWTLAKGLAGRHDDCDVSFVVRTRRPLVRGEYSGESRISLDIGLGSAEITLPENVAVRIETEGDNWLSSVDIHGRVVDEVDDDVYESDDFDSADTRIIVDMSVGLGSVDVYFK